MEKETSSDILLMVLIAVIPYLVVIWTMRKGIRIAVRRTIHNLMGGKRNEYF